LKAKNNRTITLTDEDKVNLRPRLDDLDSEIRCGDFKQLDLPRGVNLLFLDPPYNLPKKFGDFQFNRQTIQDYSTYLDKIFKYLDPYLDENASIYICGDWFSSVSIYEAASQHWIIRNRITWEREKGRGAKTNWKNSSEDIWFCTKGKEYKFDVNAIKLRRKVIAPYKEGGKAKDWDEKTGFRDTHPSNLWTDITIPFWSMSENTKHNTQKPEKLLAKLILASTEENDLVMDPFLGSGTAAVVAKKLNRRFFGCDISEEYCMLALKRLQMANDNNDIQGYTDGVFWERNTLKYQ